MKKIFENRGITLIALVITIIVLLILAGVTISAIIGNESAMEKAKQAKEANESANELDTIKLAVTDALVKETDGLVHLDKLNESLNNLVTENAEGESPWTVTGSTTGKSYIITKYGQVEEAQEVGEKVETINSKIGKQVDYASPEDSGYTGTWRLFYADSNYVFIISTTNALEDQRLDGNNKLDKSDYELGSEVVFSAKSGGKKLYSNVTYGATYNNLWKTALDEAGVNDVDENDVATKRSRATAYLCDPANWDKYVSDSAPSKTFAVGGPTKELLVKSWNAAKANNVTGAPSVTANLTNSDVSRGGYNYNKPDELRTNNPIKTDIVPLTISNVSYGLYATGSQYWLASPSDYDFNNVCMIGYNDSAYVASYNYNNYGVGIRPLICIPTSSFNVSMIID